MKTNSEGKRRKTESQNKLPAVHSDPPNPKTVCVGMRSKSQNMLPTMLSDSPNPKHPCLNTSGVKERLILDRYRYNPVSVEWQRQVCWELGLRFVCANKCFTLDSNPLHLLKGYEEIATASSVP